MLFNKKVHFSEPPLGFSVKHFGSPSVPSEMLIKASEESLAKGKTEAADFYQVEIKKLRDELGVRQNNLLGKINSEVVQTLQELEDRLPDLVLGLVERVLPGITFDRNAIEEITKSMIKEFTNDDEALEVFLCPEDLALLRGANSQQSPETEDNEVGGFASAIAGIFDNLDGDDSLLPDFPKVRFFEDKSLSRGDCQIKSRFGLLDGRISTKLRRIEESLKGDG